MFFLFPPTQAKDVCEFVNKVVSRNTFYQEKYRTFYKQNKKCSKANFYLLPYMTKDDLIISNTKIISHPFKPCKLQCSNGCLTSILHLDSTCSIGQSTGGTSGKSAYVWMNKADVLRYINTFITSFRKNGYRYGDKIMIFYPSDSYFTNEYISSNRFLSLLNVRFSGFTNVDEAAATVFVENLNIFKPDLLVVFPFVLLKLCMIIHRLKLPLEHIPKCINLSGEYLLDCTRNFISKVFHGSRIENTYGAVEFGEIAHQVAGSKNTYEVFNNFCFLENLGDNIVVTSVINETFPIIRYVMEDIGQVITKNGKQYIKNLVGKNTNVIQIDDKDFTSIDLDNMINKVNKTGDIVSIVVEYDNTKINIMYITIDENTKETEEWIMKETRSIIREVFQNAIINVYFALDCNHNYLKKFKIIRRIDKDDTEPVGGFFKY